MLTCKNIIKNVLKQLIKDKEEMVLVMKIVKFVMKCI